MITTDKLLTMAWELDIRVTYKDLRAQHPDLLGMAQADNRTVVLDKSLVGSRRKLKCILAEEIGHILFPPRPGHMAYHSTEFIRSDFNGRNNLKVIVAQDERKALDWATGVLIPDVEFWRAVRNGENTLHELAEYFDVEEWFMRIKIGYIRRKARDEGQRLKWRDLIRRA